MTSTTFVVRGRGWGHGVGMGQWGAYGQAQARRPLQEDPRPLLPGHEARRDGDLVGAHPPCRRQAKGHRRLRGSVPAPGRQGRDPRAGAGQLLDEPDLRGDARPRLAASCPPRTADLSARRGAARPRGQAVSRQPPASAHRRSPPGGERRRRRPVHPRRRERGGARRLAARGGKGAGCRCALVRARSVGRALGDPLRGYTQPGVRRRRSRVRRRRRCGRRDEAPDPDLRRQRGEYVLLLVLRRPYGQRGGRLRRRDAHPVPRLRAGSG